MSYIYDSNNITNEDHYVMIRRSITSLNTRPILHELGNGFMEQDWYGDITNWPGYEEFEEEFKDE